jgi:hypothetical protein
MFDPSITNGRVPVMNKAVHVKTLHKELFRDVYSSADINYISGSLVTLLCTGHVACYLY